MGDGSGWSLLLGAQIPPEGCILWEAALPPKEISSNPSREPESSLDFRGDPDLLGFPLHPLSFHAFSCFVCLGKPRLVFTGRSAEPSRLEQDLILGAGILTGTC